MNITLANIAEAAGLRLTDRERLTELVQVFDGVKARNERLTRYYNQDVRAAEKNLAVTVDKQLANLPMMDIRCSWPTKVVDVLCERSQFDAMWHSDKLVKEEFDRILVENRLKYRYDHALKSELIHGCVFATLAMGDDDRAQIRFHSAETAAAIWDPQHETVECGIAIIDTDRYNGENDRTPSLVNMYTQDATIVIQKLAPAKWAAEYHEHPMGRPLMVPMVYKQTFDKPFGHSRINKDVISDTDAYLRERLRLEVQSEMYSTPQRYIVGLSDEAAATFAKNKIKQYMSCMMLLTQNEDGSPINMGQFDQAPITPHRDVLEMLARHLASAANIPMSELGVVHEQPSSAEAITLEKEPLVLEAQALNDANGEALKEIVLMAYAMNNGLTWSEIPYDVKQIQAHYDNPAYPSIVSMADGVVKIAAGSQTPFGRTSAFWASCGFDDIETRQILEEMDQVQIDGVLAGIFNNDTTTTTTTTTTTDGVPELEDMKVGADGTSYRVDIG